MPHGDRERVKGVIPCGVWGNAPKKVAPFKQACLRTYADRRILGLCPTTKFTIHNAQCTMIAGIFPLQEKYGGLFYSSNNYALSIMHSALNCE